MALVHPIVLRGFPFNIRLSADYPAMNGFTSLPLLSVRRKSRRQWQKQERWSLPQTSIGETRTPVISLVS